MRGSLQERSGKYYAVFRVNGKQKWINLGIPTKKGNKRKAQDALNELLAKYNKNPNMFEKTEFTGYIKEWLDSVKKTVDTITYEGYKSCTKNHIIPYFNENKIMLQDIKVSDIEEYYNTKAINGRLDGKGGLSLRTIKLHGTVLSLVFSRAVRNHLVSENPCAYAKYPEAVATEKIQPVFYSVKQFKTLLECIKGTMLHDMVYITYMYGLRRSELMGLKWNAIDFDNDTISIRHTVVLQETIVRKDKTKNKPSKRTYPLLPEIKTIFERLLKQQEASEQLFGNCYNHSGYVFVKADGTPYYPSYPTHALEKALKKYQLPQLRLHDLRHSTASMLIEKRWHMKDISEWIGHADIGTTMNTYGHLSMEHKKELGKDLEGLLA